MRFYQMVELAVVVWVVFIILTFALLWVLEKWDERTKYDR